MEYFGVSVVGGNKFIVVIDCVGLMVFYRVCVMYVFCNFKVNRVSIILNGRGGLLVLFEFR